MFKKIKEFLSGKKMTGEESAKSGIPARQVEPETSKKMDPPVTADEQAPAAHRHESATKPGETPISEEVVAPLSDDLKPDGGISWFDHLKKKLIKTRHSLKLKLEELIGRHKKIDDDFMEGLEEILISSDLGVKTTRMILSHFEEIARIEKIDNAKQLMDLIKEVLLVILDDEPKSLNVGPGRLNVILMIGVNGVGKTTTIGKLAARYVAGGKKVLLAAGDTFRAGAIEQLEVWGHRSGCEVISYEQGGDSGAVVYDAIQAARSRGADILIIDTAGRLHNKFNLMEELKKVRRVIGKEVPDGPHETLLVIDANTGQNGIVQAKVFRDEMAVTGIVLTKIDGTAKGGVTVAIKEELKLPVKLIGIGEKMNDLRIFNSKDFIQALLEE